MVRRSTSTRKLVKDQDASSAQQTVPTLLEARVVAPRPADRAAVGRVVLAGAAAKSLTPPGDSLTTALKAMRRENVSVRYLVTPGGFLKVSIEDTWRGEVGWTSSSPDMRPLHHAAEAAIARLVARLPSDAAESAQYATIGVDVSTNSGMRHAPFAELVALYDMSARQVMHWTAKSYPTSDQASYLIHETDFSSHNMICGRDRLLILGCHDLTAYSPKGNVNAKPGGRRHRRIKAMQQAFASFRPTLVVHHPHTTDTSQSWRASWSGLEANLIGMGAWLSAIRWRNPNGRERQALSDVLARTHGSAVQPIDIVVADHNSMAAHW